MSRKTINKDTRERMKALEAQGYTNVRCEVTGGNHVRIFFTHEGKEYRLITPLTASDHRSTSNMLRDARRAIQGINSRGHK